MKQLTPSLVLANIEVCVPFRVDLLGSEKAGARPEGGRLGARARRMSSRRLVCLLALLASCTSPPERRPAMTGLLEVRHISVSIDCRPGDVYDFAADPRNVPRWASGLAGTITPSGDEWIAEAPVGRVRIRFTPRNDLLVLDHDVTLPSGVTIHNPMRVLPNGRGSEVVFTLFRQPGTSDAKFAEDARWVEKDLHALKALLEAPASPPH